MIKLRILLAPALLVVGCGPAIFSEAGNGQLASVSQSSSSQPNLNDGDITVTSQKGDIRGAEVVFLPGSLVIGTSVQVEQGQSFVAAPASAALDVSSSGGSDEPALPFTIKLPLYAAGLSLADSQGSRIVIIHLSSAGQSLIEAGLDLQDGFVVFTARYFGTYQAAYKNAKKLSNDGESLEYTLNGLAWSRVAERKQAWNAAEQYCRRLEQNGRSGWRLPSDQDLIDARDADIFSSAQSILGDLDNLFWSSTVSVGGRRKAKAGLLRPGNNSDWRFVTNRYKVICVESAQ